MVSNEHLTQSELAKPSLRRLFFTFLRLGATSFGGPAMVAYIHRLVVDRLHWVTARRYADGVALCQMIPGATAMQAAAFVGLTVRGVRGALASFIGFGLPSFLLMTGLAITYEQVQHLPEVIAVFAGLQAIAIAIIANAGIAMARRFITDGWGILIALVAITMFAFSLNPFYVVLVGAFLGLCFYHKEHYGVPRLKTALSRSLIVKRALMLLSPFVVYFAVLYVFNIDVFHLALLFSRIDLYAFGGGFASLPIMFHEVVQVHNWMDSGTFLNGVALGQVTPGPIIITATFVGYMLHGGWGAIIGTFSIFAPSFIILSIAEPFYLHLRANDVVRWIIKGVLITFVGLILVTAVKFALPIPWDVPRVLLTGFALATLLCDVDIVWVVLVGLGLSVLIF
jgi:chromate transporter